MDTAVREVAAQFDLAVELSRTAREPRDRDRVLDLLHEAAYRPTAAFDVAAGHAGDADAVSRLLACDLLGVLAESHVDLQPRVAAAVLAAYPAEADEAVTTAMARALGACADPRGLPALLDLAGHRCADVRRAVAAALPWVMFDELPEAGIAALLRLSADVDPEVRNWATFGLGWMLPVDSPEIRAALVARLADAYPDAREEGIRGLARRRDRRALPYVAELLAREDAHVHTFDAAAFLGDPALLPLLDKYNVGDPGVAGAVRECDPAAAAEREARAWQLYARIADRWPELPVALYCDRFELGVYLDIAPLPGRGAPLTMPPAVAGAPVEVLLNRAGGDVARAADLVVADLFAALTDD